MDDWDGIRATREINSQQSVEKSINSIGSDHFPIMISSKYQYNHDDFCMASWNVLSTNYTLRSMGHWNRKSASGHMPWVYDRATKTLSSDDLSLLQLHYDKDTIVINHLKKCLLTCDCNHAKEKTTIPKMDVLALQEVNEILLEHLKYNFGSYYHIYHNFNTENLFECGGYGDPTYCINNEAWVPDGVALLVNKAKYDIIPGLEHPVNDFGYYKGILVPFIKKVVKPPGVWPETTATLDPSFRGGASTRRFPEPSPSEPLTPEEMLRLFLEKKLVSGPLDIVVFGSFHMHGSNSNAFRSYGPDLVTVQGIISEIKNNLSAIIKRKEGELIVFRGYALGLDSNQFARRHEGSVGTMNAALKKIGMDEDGEGGQDVYYPTYHSAVDRSGRDTYPIDLIITNLDLLEDKYVDSATARGHEVRLGLDYDRNSITRNPEQITYDDDDDDGGFSPFIRESDKKNYKRGVDEHLGSIILKLKQLDADAVDTCFGKARDRTLFDETGLIPDLIDRIFSNDITPKEAFYIQYKSERRAVLRARAAEAEERRAVLRARAAEAEERRAEEIARAAERRAAERAAAREVEEERAAFIATFPEDIKSMLDRGEITFENAIYML